MAAWLTQRPHAHIWPLRTQEIDNSTHKVETELAARDMTRLKRMLELESVRVQTEMMQQKLDDGHVDEEERVSLTLPPPRPTPHPTTATAPLPSTPFLTGRERVHVPRQEISADELLFEQDPQVRLEQLEQEISRVR